MCFSLAVSGFSTVMVKSMAKGWLLSANQEPSPHASHGLPEVSMSLIPKGNKADVRRVWKTLYHFRELAQHAFLIALLYGPCAKYCHQ